MGNKQRQFERAPFHGSIAVCRSRNPRVVQSANIGAGGVLLTTDEPLPPRSLLTLRINMPEGGGFTVLGRVVRTAEAQRTMAVEFVDILPRERARLDAYVNVCGAQTRAAG